ncbi:hypothetical protein F441_17702 [Phytophthora nicotianae CJ01A1]|uniref:Uncharacterized protein n=6 Tax=Phytophthora nicotianae TaxID=4792 RepID=W2QZT2_PHYN3|nr:hypothetical protein PPTG_21590 [Phytophthora nicotianae INRA-310]ETI35932.1 hypothetical protein F443_17828 [Phytophthora nicotianae P1569]ETK76172.1 hypothetical protein L915_17354 [Phytophthora nicotianae]ETO64655.1 hypothetical protein F444_17865 [Phytophthora nicotianae P1976]ETP05755.1 hypothetical protein F441_17702 [Phytophthora nicotianae CJ01A1]ETP33867.1 hypothetical protein F442_17683 [Phytophthora nicotianae P10297]
MEVEQLAQDFENLPTLIEEEGGTQWFVDMIFIANLKLSERLLRRSARELFPHVRVFGFMVTFLLQKSISIPALRRAVVINSVHIACGYTSGQFKPTSY